MIDFPETMKRLYATTDLTEAELIRDIVPT
jgi:hypothetical protein